MDEGLLSASIRLSAILKQRCPRCMQGKVFATLWDMESHCPVCHLEFEREPGYFLGAMYFSYGLAIISGAPTLFLMLGLGAANLWIVLALACQLALSSPLLFRYSRVMWLHFDQIFDPR
jgi:uncharacterized protein (DUF983 family)